MTSIGNDIIALSTIDQQRTEQHQFYSKILAPSEQQLYHEQQPAQLPFYIYVWLLWSAKEAVYKFLKRLSPDLVFSPTRIVITDIVPEPGHEGYDDLSGNTLRGFSLNISSADKPISPNRAFSSVSLQLTFLGNSYYTRSFITPAFIVTFANNVAAFEHIYWGVKQIEHTDQQAQSAGVRIFFSEALKELYPTDEFSIEKARAGYPVISKNRSETAFKVSFAHHYNYVSYAFALE